MLCNYFVLQLDVLHRDAFRTESTLLTRLFFVAHVHSKRRSTFVLASGNFHIPTFHIAYGRFKVRHFALGRFGEWCFTLV